MSLVLWHIRLSPRGPQSGGPPADRGPLFIFPLRRPEKRRKKTITNAHALPLRRKRERKSMKKCNRNAMKQMFFHPLPAPSLEFVVPLRAIQPPKSSQWEPKERCGERVGVTLTRTRIPSQQSALTLLSLLLLFSIPFVKCLGYKRKNQ